MSEWEFKPDHFCHVHTFTDVHGNEHTTQHGMILISWSQAAEFANARLKQWLERAPFVYGIGNPGEPYDGDEDYWWRTRSGEDTHTARLVDIQEIEEKK